MIKANVKAVTIGPGFEDRLDHINEIITKPDSFDFDKFSATDGKPVAIKS